MKCNKMDTRISNLWAKNHAMKCGSCRLHNRESAVNVSDEIRKEDSNADYMRKIRKYDGITTTPNCDSEDEDEEELQSASPDPDTIMKEL